MNRENIGRHAIPTRSCDYEMTSPTRAERILHQFISSSIRLFFLKWAARQR
jgi:hypothetical protein